MKRELFIPYKDTITRCILSSITPEQLQVCWDIIERFGEKFRGVMTIDELNEAIIDLKNTYQLKLDQQTVF